MNITIIILLILLGIFLLVLEILVVPGGILGLVALGIMAFGVYSMYGAYGIVAGHITLASTVILSLGLIITSLKSKAWKRLANSSVISSRMNTIDENLVKIGDTGIALSELRPMGNGLFSNERMEVTTEGEKIAAQSAIEIFKIEDNKIFVRKTNL